MSLARKLGAPHTETKNHLLCFTKRGKHLILRLPRLAGQFVTPLPAAYITLNHYCINDELNLPAQSPFKTTTKSHTHIWACDSS